MSEMTNITTEASDSPVSNKTVLRLDDVRKSFGNTQVLRGISFDIHQHEVVALLGPSGSGKSTLMKCVNLLEQVDDGQIWLGNTDITDPRADQDKIRASCWNAWDFPLMQKSFPLSSLAASSSAWRLRAH